MLKVVKFNLPVNDNAGKSLAINHAALKKDLARSFGGFTAYEGQGGWIDKKTGELFDEAVRVYEVAIRVDQWCDFSRVCDFHARKAGQWASYLVDFDGNALVNDLRDAVAPTALRLVQEA